MGLLDLITGFGLSSSAGLNAYIPLLAVALLARAGELRLAEPFAWLASDEVLLALFVLLLIEFFVDKIPGVDFLNDVIQTFVRPAAGAIAFAMSAGIITDLSPTLALIIGLFPAAGVHAVKMTTRPAVNLLTMGIGAPFVSFAEDVSAVLGVVLAILLPILFLVFAFILAIVVWQLVRYARGRQRDRALARAYAYQHPYYPARYPPRYPPYRP
ncbi:MAG: DUF4126 domain-containing protein [Anaerolineae bacterium]|nr:DUF4126 domain-containing protein [Thermoflexales bacterium]MDW8394808.1 DUF4126 domain-containing protein [Anaerolineae bacterium]